MPQTQYLLASKQPGHELVSTFIDRPEGMSDEDYRNLARQTGSAAVRHMQQLGVAGRHFVLTIKDALTPEETEGQIRLAHAIEDAGGTLPTTADVLSSM